MNERQKKLKGAKIGMTVGVILLALGLLFMCLPIPSEIKGFSILFILIGIGVTIGFMTEKKRIMRSYCPACGKKYDYEEDVEWVEGSEEEKDNGKTASLVSTVDFTCTCSNCGNESSFTEKFTVAKRDENGKITRYNLKDLARKYFVK